MAIMRSQPLADNLRVIITDHVMPGATGAEFVRALRRVDLVVPVIVISGLPEIDTEYQGLNVRFLSKPCPPQIMIDTVKQCIAQADDSRSHAK